MIPNTSLSRNADGPHPFGATSGEEVVELRGQRRQKADREVDRIWHPQLAQLHRRVRRRTRSVINTESLEYLSSLTEIINGKLMEKNF